MLVLDIKLGDSWHIHGHIEGTYNLRVNEAKSIWLITSGINI